MEDMSVWTLDPSHTMGGKKKSLNLMFFLWNVNTLFVMVFKDREVERYNLFSSLEDIKRMIRNQIFFLDKIDFS